MKYLCFDIESCDGGKNGSLCSFGYCIADENFNILEQEDIIVNPKKAFNKRLFGSVIKLAYTEEVFRSAPRFPLVYDRIKSLFDGDVVVIGFSITNDVNYLFDSIRTYKLEPFYYDFFDVQLMYSIYKGEAKNFSLLAAASEFNIEYLEHRSVDDAVATLKVLQGLLEKSGKTFNEFVSEYGINKGSISPDGITNCFTDVIYWGVDYSSLKIKKRLLNEFLISLGHAKKSGLKFSRKVVCFDENLELDDVTLTRNRIVKLYELGGRYCSGVESSNLFVYDGTESARYKFAVRAGQHGHKMRLMPIDKFLELLGDVPNVTYNDAALLLAGNKRRRLNRERAAQKNQSKQKKAQSLQKKNSKTAKKNNPSREKANNAAPTNAGNAANAAANNANSAAINNVANAATEVANNSATVAGAKTLTAQNSAINSANSSPVSSSPIASSSNSSSVSSAPNNTAPIASSSNSVSPIASSNNSTSNNTTATNTSSNRSSRRSRRRHHKKSHAATN